MNYLSIIIFSFVLVISCNNTTTNKESVMEKDSIISDEDTNFLELQSLDTIFTFEDEELGKIPSNWSQYFTGKEGENPNWEIVDDNGNYILAQLSEDNPNYHFNDIVFDGFEAKNVELKVKMKGVEGRMDQGGGFIWRFIDADNYYVVRANPLEDNVVLYKVENGKRTDLPVLGKGRTYGVDVKPLGDDWNDLKLTVVDNLFTVYLNEEQLFQVEDDTFTKKGKIGLWTKADAVSYFDDFQINILDN